MRKTVIRVFRNLSQKKKYRLAESVFFQSTKGSIICCVCLPVWNLKLKVQRDKIVDYRLETNNNKGKVSIKKAEKERNSDFQRCWAEKQCQPHFPECSILPFLSPFQQSCQSDGMWRLWIFVWNFWMFQCLVKGAALISRHLISQRWIPWECIHVVQGHGFLSRKTWVEDWEPGLGQQPWPDEGFWDARASAPDFPRILASPGCPGKARRITC